ncbi:hypothetical protein CU254_12620 [Amycolatopsis sp. AA4]|nr:hypothetical protein CU254_12620 [Amycolatopsis sp. AA4]
MPRNLLLNVRGKRLKWGFMRILTACANFDVRLFGPGNARLARQLPGAIRRRAAVMEADQRVTGFTACWTPTQCPSSL